ncbi:MAG TPA: lipid-A-disaccharide synthase [Pyrinomonadaceae bacterium]|jgi:lipid-A-disaccharide synthase|nr:lipid-A-disaccharide synthase [Pyrinomonadaceae bacterium]
MEKSVSLMIVAGEPSGDAHAAALVNALREKLPQTRFHFFGSAGQKMREAGVEAVIRADDLSIVGIPEITRALPMFWQTFRKLKEAAVQRKPDAVVLVDFPDFNLRLARSLKKAGLNVIYYISPQLWAWRRYRAQIIRKYVDLLLAILPFEKDWYAGIGIGHVEYVGNPLAGEVKAKKSKAEFCREHQLDEGRPIVALLPGSRHKELVRILPGLLETAGIIERNIPGAQFVVALAGSRNESEVAKIIAGLKTKNISLPENILTVHSETLEALAAADVAVVTSGTATLETAIIGTPMVIVYKTSGFNYKTLRPLIDVPHFGLINLIAQERLAVELIQDDFTPEILSKELLSLLEPESNAGMRKRLKEVAETLGQGGASERAADAVLRFLSGAETRA